MQLTDYIYHPLVTHAPSPYRSHMAARPSLYSRALVLGCAPAHVHVDCGFFPRRSSKANSGETVSYFRSKRAIRNISTLEWSQFGLALVLVAEMGTHRLRNGWVRENSQKFETGVFYEWVSFMPIQKSYQLTLPCFTSPARFHLLPTRLRPPAWHGKLIRHTWKSRSVGGAPRATACVATDAPARLLFHKHLFAGGALLECAIPTSKPQ